MGVFARLVRLDEYLAGLTMGAMLILGIAAMIARGLGTPIIWSEEVLRNTLVWLTMLGALAATRRGEHIVVRLGGEGGEVTRFGLAWQVVIDVGCAACCLVYAYNALIYLQAFGSVKLISVSWLPLTVFMAAVPIGLVLMAVAFLARAFANVSSFRTIGASQP